MNTKSIHAITGGVMPGAAQAALDALDCQVAVLAASGHVVMANNAWRRLAKTDAPGVTPVPAGRNYLRVFERPVTGAALHAAAGVHAVLTRHKKRISVEYPCDTCGEKLWFKIDATACDIGGAPHTVVVQRSIAPSRPDDATAGREPDRSTERGLRARLTRKDEFVAILAHELRNAFAPIANAVQLLTRHPDDARAIHGAKAIMQRQLQQVTRLLEDMSNASHKDCGDFEVKRLKVDICEPVMVAVESVRSLLDMRRRSLPICLSTRPNTRNLAVASQYSRAKKVASSKCVSVTTESGSRPNIRSRFLQFFLE
jgi:signal transduction histidine kinase